MRRFHAVTVAILATMIGACTSTHRNADVPALCTPLKVEFDKPGSVPGRIRLQSGQMIDAPRCCPPLELQDANGRVVQKLRPSAAAQRIVAPGGIYSLVGHDPVGKEHAIQIEVTDK